MFRNPKSAWVCIKDPLSNMNAVGNINAALTTAVSLSDYEEVHGGR